MKLRDDNLQVNLNHVFDLHFFKMHHHYFFEKGFESVLALFILGNITGK